MEKIILLLILIFSIGLVSAIDENCSADLSGELYIPFTSMAMPLSEAIHFEPIYIGGLSCGWEKFLNLIFEVNENFIKGIRLYILLLLTIVILFIYLIFIWNPKKKEKESEEYEKEEK